MYLEYSNEVWNFGFQQAGQNHDIVVADQSANNAEWSILNFDGAVAQNNLHRLLAAHRSTRASCSATLSGPCIGDAAMPPNTTATVRPLLMFQAGNGQATGGTQLQFLDDFFNNSDGVVSRSARRTLSSYFFWGGGGCHLL